MTMSLGKYLKELEEKPIASMADLLSHASETKNASIPDASEGTLLAFASIPDASNMLANASERTSLASTDASNMLANASERRGRAGGLARTACMTAEERSALARRAAQSRWAKKTRKQPIGFNVVDDADEGNW